MLKMAVAYVDAWLRMVRASLSEIYKTKRLKRVGFLNRKKVVGALETISKMLLVIKGKTFLLTESTKIMIEIPNSLPQKGLAI